VSTLVGWGDIKGFILIYYLNFVKRKFVSKGYGDFEWFGGRGPDVENEFVCLRWRVS